jgi:hypothetical protein
MEEFAENYIKQFDNYKRCPVHFIGSIVSKKEELEIVSKNTESKIGNVLRRPIDGLIAYHIMNK